MKLLLAVVTVYRVVVFCCGPRLSCRVDKRATLTQSYVILIMMKEIHEQSMAAVIIIMDASEDAGKQTDAVSGTIGRGCLS